MPDEHVHPEEFKNYKRRQDDHEHRTTALEEQVKSIDAAVSATRIEMARGFDAIQESFGRIEKIQYDRSSELHKRIDDHEKSSQITMPLILSFAMVLIAIGGILVAYVNMRVSPTETLLERQIIARDKELDRMSRVFEIALDKTDERSQARLCKLEEWQKWWYQSNINMNRCKEDIQQ